MSSTNTDGTALPADYPDDEAAFTDLVDGSRRILVYFYAEWCRQCEEMNPVVADAAERIDGGVLWVNVEAHPAIAARHDVAAVPTLLAFDRGEPDGRVVGRQDRSTIKAVMSV
jgi:thioredoxin 1